MIKRYSKRALIPIAIVTLTACGGIVGKSSNSNSGGDSSAPMAGTNDNGSLGADLIGGGNNGAGNGANVPGTGSMTGPTADAVIARLKNGMANNVNPLAGNFARTLTQVRTNLPKVTDPIKATGFDQVQLLAYGACSDLTTGTPGLMSSQYGVTKGATVASQSAALVTAGVRILDAHTAGLASTSSANAEVRTAFQTLVSKIGAVAGNNSTIAFMAVCIAANTAGSSMMGF